MFSRRVSEIIWMMVLSNILLISSQDRCPDGQERPRPTKRFQHQSLGFLIPLKNTTRCLGQPARLRVFFLGDNFTLVNLYKEHPSNGSAQLIAIDGKKYHKVPGEERDQDDYYIYICDLTFDDIGWYSVELRNRVGPVVRKAFVDVIACNDVNQAYRSGSAANVTDANRLLAPSESQASEVKVFVLLGLGLLLIVAVVAVAVACFCYRQSVTKQRRRRRRQNEVVHMNPIYNQIPAPLQPDALVLPPSDPFWEIHQDCLHLEDLLGEGAFGKVFRGNYVGPNCPSLVAVKMLKDDCTYKDRTDFVKEIEMMKTIGRHRNIICFYGYSITQDGCIQVVVEYAKHGSLRDFLRRLKPASTAAAEQETDAVDASIQLGMEVGRAEEEGAYLTPVESGDTDGSSRVLTFPDLISFCFQVARGMEYLASRKIIHRDLAARNILVADDVVLKIADFGLTRNTQVRNYYQRSSSGLLPVMWMAPESLADNRYTTRSDVWSFGVLLWEIFSFGADPYAGIPPEELLDRLLQGFRMHKPQFCSDEVADIISRCWQLNPNSRPDFTQLVQSFDRFVTSSTSVLYLSLEHLTYDDTDNDDVFQPDALPCQPAPDTRLHAQHPQQHPQSSVDSQYASLSTPSHSSASSSFGDNVCATVEPGSMETGSMLGSMETGSMLDSDRFTLDSDSVTSS